MRKVGLVLCLLGSIALSSAAAQTWLAGSLDDALAKAKAAGRPLLVDFFTEVG
ncbi:MAG: hypothetical protein NTU60_08910 [Candidatus Aminicenantes bacterium]|nr:hypothetical protein [Candidatus Aminicenantes bacterium]